MKSDEELGGAHRDVREEMSQTGIGPSGFIPSAEGEFETATHAEPIALAGIMGGRASEARESSSRLVLESANFTAGTIRRTSTRLGVRSDASQRFEKSQPPVNVRTGAARALKLMEDAGLSWSATTRFTVVGDLASAKSYPR